MGMLRNIWKLIPFANTRINPTNGNRQYYLYISGERYTIFETKGN